MKTGNLIDVKNVSLVYSTKDGDITVFTDISFQAKKGEHLCIIGPSGCGKTTVLNMLAGFLKPTSGEVFIEGNPVREPGPDRTVVFQKDSVYPWLTVRKNLEFGPKVRGVKKGEYEERVNTYLKKVNLEEFADRFPKELSGGMRKRVDIARAYVNSPRILLMDEPFGALDVMTKENMQTDLLELCKEEKTSFVFITHDIEEAVFIGDRVLVMTARPAKIAADISIPFSREERQPAIKRTPEFQRLRGEIGEIFKGGEANAKQG